MTEPSGALTEWKASVVGRSATTLREFLEKKYEDGLETEAAIRLSIETLMEVVEGGQNLEICVMHKNKKIEILDEDIVKAIVDELAAEKEAAAEAKKKKKD